MSNSDHGLNWWEEAKAQSLERKKAKTQQGSGDSFLIVTEGTVTEPVYFKLLLDHLELSTVKVILMPSRRSDPMHVIEMAVNEVKELARRDKKGELSVTEVAKYDQVWAVIDTDVAVGTGVWNEVVGFAKKNKVKLAYSTPCIEFWFLLHLKFTTAQIQDGAAAKSLLNKELSQPYSTNEKEAQKAISQFFPSWPDAVTRSEKVRESHQSANTPEPANPSTDVDLLVRALNNAAPQHKRKL